MTLNFYYAITDPNRPSCVQSYALFGRVLNILFFSYTIELQLQDSERTPKKYVQIRQSDLVVCGF